jgi:transcriptional regulator with GAF, ATPase, and Fis domain
MALAGGPCCRIRWPSWASLSIAMPLHPKDFSDVSTDLKAPPPGYSRSYPRHPLRVTWTDATGAKSSMVAQRAVIGSAKGVDVFVADPTVSKLHADVEPREDGIWIRDLGSKNGTYIEGILVREGCVPEGGSVRVGSTLLVMQRDPETADVDLWPEDHFGGLIGRSTVMRELFASLARLAPTDSSVLIQGETGTGKELVARALHEASGRAGAPFVVVDCGALPENLLETELFGHSRGAFTGAAAAREGAIESADGGTVFLDEIGEVPLSMQPKLLRVLEARTVRRVGETEHRKVDVRFIAATHRNLRAMVNAGAFREDLYFRLSVLPIVVPPLRDRLEDVPLLVQAFLASHGAEWPEGFLMSDLTQRPWLGNVRELRTFVERALIFGPEKALTMTGARNIAGPEAANASTLDRPLKEAREIWMDRFEREYLTRLLERTGRNVLRAAQEAGVHRTYVYRLIVKYGL